MDQGIEVVELSLRYTDSEGEHKTILAELSVRTGPGEFVLLSGHSGCGKSTLLNCINGVLWNDQRATIAGSIRVCGHSVDQRSVAELSRSVGTVLQDPESQLFNTECVDEVAFGLRNLGLPPDTVSSRTTEWAERFDLNPEWPTDHLSGGQAQRVILASVLAMDAPILLLDEPFAHLDRIQAQTLLSLLKHLAARGKSIILVEHRLDLVLPCIDRMLWMEQGRIVEDLKSKEAQQAYGHRFRWFPQATARDFSGRPATSAAEPAKTICTVDRLSVRAGKELQIGPVSFDLEESEILTIVGDNGTGKTTLLRCLCGLHPPSAGRCRFHTDGRTRLSVGLVFQNPSYQLFVNTVRGELSCRCEDPSLSDKLIQLLGLESLLDRHPVSLSEGQKRILTIAAVAAADPAVLLLDEPTVGQDHAGFGRILDAVEFLRNERRTSIVAVTHDQRCLHAFADRVMLLKDGVLSTVTSHQYPRRSHERPTQEEEIT